MSERPLEQHTEQMIRSHYKIAYGLLWKYKGDDPLVHRARKTLLALLSRPDQEDAFRLADDVITGNH